MLIFRRFDCICTTSGTVTVCERPYVTLVKRELAYLCIKLVIASKLTVNDASTCEFLGFCCGVAEMFILLGS